MLNYQRVYDPLNWICWLVLKRTSPSPRGPRGVERPAAPWRALHRYGLANPAKLPGMRWKWGNGYPLNSRQCQITLIGKMNKAQNSRGIVCNVLYTPFSASLPMFRLYMTIWLSVTLSPTKILPGEKGEKIWFPLGNVQGRAALCSRAAVAYFVTLSSHTSLPTCNWGFGSCKKHNGLKQQLHSARNR